MQSTSGLEWTVSTVVVDAAGKQTVARTIDYPLGEWEEKFEGGSALFGDAAGTVKRTTAWEAQATSTSGVRVRVLPLQHPVVVPYTPRRLLREALGFRD